MTRRNYNREEEPVLSTGLSPPNTSPVAKRLQPNVPSDAKPGPDTQPLVIGIWSFGFQGGALRSALVPRLCQEKQEK
jgi:hypothetical protein